MTNPEPPRTVGGRLHALVRLMASAVMLLVLVAGVPYGQTTTYGEMAHELGDLVLARPRVVRLPVARRAWA